MYFGDSWLPRRNFTKRSIALVVIFCFIFGVIECQAQSQFTIELWVFSNDVTGTMQPLVGQWKGDTGDKNSTFRLSIGYDRIEFCGSFAQRTDK